MTEKFKSIERSPSNHMEYVGLISSQWATLEFYINSTIHVLAGVKHEVGACMTANLGSIHMKLRTLQALLELYEVNPKLLKEIKKFQDRVSGTADKRNRVVHDPWLPIISPTLSGMGQFISKADRKGREFGSKMIPLSDLVTTNREIMERIDEFMELRKKIKVELPTYAKKLS